MKTNVIKQGGGKSLSPAGLRRKLLPVLIAGCFSTAPVLANPTGPQVVNGQVSIASQGNVLTVTNSPGAIINWQSFSIGQGELTRFVQQGASSTVLNRIIGQDPSQILGALQSNGRVFLINPNGILFGQGAQVNVAGLVASTLNISNEDFLAGRMKFQAGDKAANLQNQGSITTASGGQIYLVAPNVENSGILTSPKGEVVLAAGQSVHLVDSANPDLHVVVSAPENQAVNLGQVVAESGKIGIYGALIKQRGLVSADSAVVGENGKIVFKASKDALLEAGSVTTATGAGKGGTVHVLGERVGLTGNAKVDVSGQTGGGTVLVGGDYQGKNSAVVNAKQTLLGRDAEIKADAVQQGDGGKVILWSDELTRAYGSISAKGGQQGGNGGFVEVSGKQKLVFDANVNTSAAKGKVGMLLLDPQDIIIQNGTAAAGDSALNLDNFVDGADANSSTDITISEAKLESLSGNVTLQASRDVILQNLSDNTLGLANVAGPSAFVITAGRDIRVDDVNDIIQTGGGSVNFTTSTGNINIAKVMTNGGGVTMNAGGTLNVGTIGTSGGASAGNITLTSGGAMTLGSTGDINAIASAPGDVRLTAGGAINMLNGNVIRANRLKATAAGGITDGSGGPVYIQVNTLNAANSGAGDIYFYNTATSNLSIDSIDGAPYGIRQDAGGENVYIDTDGNLNILSPTSTGNGDIYLWAGLGLSNSTSVTASNGNVDLDASGGNLLNSGSVQAGNGTAYLYSPSGAINNTGSVSANNGAVYLDASTGISHYGTISNNGGYTQLLVSDVDASIYTDPASQIVNPDGYIDLMADKMDLRGTVNSGNGYVSLMPYSASSAIDVGTGGANGTAATLELSNSELNLITARKLVIGDGNNTGTLTIKSSFMGGPGGAAEHISETVSFYTDGLITQAPGAIIAIPAVEAIGASVALMEANPTGVVSGETTAGDFQYRTTNLLTVSYSHLSSGIIAPATGTIYLQSDSTAGINQQYGSPVIGGQLVLKTPGPVYLDYYGNAVSKLAADLNVGGTGIGSLTLLNADNLTIDGPFYGINGITTNNQSVEISVEPGYTITQNQSINAGSASVIMNSSGILTTSPPLSHTPIYSETITNNSTNTIVASISSVTTQLVTQPQYPVQEKDTETSHSSDLIVREETSGASKNEVAQKLYCN